MNNFFCTLQEGFVQFSNILPSWGQGCPDCNSVSNILPTFKFRARKKSVFGWCWWCFVYVHIPVNDRVGDGFLGQMRPLWAICTKSGQKCSSIGGKEFNHKMVSLLFRVIQPDTFNDDKMFLDCLHLQLLEHLRWYYNLNWLKRLRFL